MIKKHQSGDDPDEDQVPLPPLDQLTPYLGGPWLKERTDDPDRTAAFRHPEGHHIGLRVQPGDLIIQTWITAGPDLPPLSAGTATERANAQAANDARLQPGRSWYATVAIREADDLTTAVASVLHDQLIPALTHKPKRALTVTYGTDPETGKKSRRANTETGDATSKDHKKGSKK
ncbi:hypothetical protein [Streptomyces sp. NPDC095613]|uniref:hypothetical protein n=1 Tax=Streptomyces sp. NPDC095613 TaxID=3155540 RepID=UPI00332BB6F2